MLSIVLVVLVSSTGYRFVLYVKSAICVPSQQDVVSVCPSRFVLGTHFTLTGGLQKVDLQHKLDFDPLFWNRVTPIGGTNNLPPTRTSAFRPSPILECSRCNTHFASKDCVSRKAMPHSEGHSRGTNRIHLFSNCHSDYAMSIQWHNLGQLTPILSTIVPAIMD